MTQSNNLLKAAWIIATVTILSKAIGFIRDVIIAKYYGAGVVSDAYFYAYQIPSLALIILGGVGGPFHSATVAVFSKLIPPNLNEKAPEKAKSLFRIFMSITFISFFILMLLTFIFSDVIMQFIITGGDKTLISLASLHLKIMTPILVLGGIIGIYYGLLVTYGKFFIPNISPLIMSLIIIFAIVLSKNDPNGIVLAIATTIGALAQLIFQIPLIQKIGYNFKFNFSFKKNKDFKNILELLFPAILSSTVGQLYIYIDMFFASHLQTGAWTAIGYANRVFQFPVGILVTAFLVPLFPLFSKFVVENKIEDIKYYFNKGIGTLNLLVFPILLTIILFGFDIIQILFERGAFNTNATIMVYKALLYLSIGILPYVFRDSITRIFYAFNDSKTPFLVALFSIIAKYLLNFVFINVLHFSLEGITLSTALVTLLNACLLGILLNKKIQMNYKIYFINLIKMFIASIFTFIISKYLLQFAPQVNNIVSQMIYLILYISIIFIIYFIFAFLLKIDYIQALLVYLKNKLQKNK